MNSILNNSNCIKASTHVDCYNWFIDTKEKKTTKKINFKGFDSSGHTRGELVKRVVKLAIT